MDDTLEHRVTTQSQPTIEEPDSVLLNEQLAPLDLVWFMIHAKPLAKVSSCALQERHHRPPSPPWGAHVHVAIV